MKVLAIRCGCIALPDVQTMAEVDDVFERKISVSEGRVVRCKQQSKALLVWADTKCCPMLALGDAVPQHEDTSMALECVLQDMQVVEFHLKCADEMYRAARRDLNQFLPVGRPSGPIQYLPVFGCPDSVLVCKVRGSSPDCQAEDVANLLQKDFSVKPGTYLKACEMVFRSVAPTRSAATHNQTSASILNAQWSIIGRAPEELRWARPATVKVEEVQIERLHLWTGVNHLPSVRITDWVADTDITH
jgi:hypothetical protein